MILIPGIAWWAWLFSPDVWGFDSDFPSTAQAVFIGRQVTRTHNKWPTRTEMRSHVLITVGTAPPSSSANIHEAFWRKYIWPFGLPVCFPHVLTSLVLSSAVMEVCLKKMGTLPETNMAPANRASQKETSIPTIHFQVRAVSFREGILWYFQEQISNIHEFWDTFIDFPCWATRGLELSGCTRRVRGPPKGCHRWKGVAAWP